MSKRKLEQYPTFRHWLEFGIPPPLEHEHDIEDVTDLQTTLDGKAALVHSHIIGDVTNLQTSLNGKAAIIHSHAIADVTNLQTSLDGKAATSHTHTIANVTGLQTALDEKAATSHTHVIGDVTNLQTSLDGKAATSHTHTIANVTGLQTALDEKAATSHTHVIGDVTNLQTSLDGKAATSHTHTIANVTGLQTALDGKAASSHTHAIGDVTNLQTSLDGKAATSHTHTIANVTGLQTALDGKSSTTHSHSLLDSATNLRTPNTLALRDVNGYAEFSGLTLPQNNLKQGMQGVVAGSDTWFVGGFSAGTNAGYCEISTGDDGTEPIYVRQFLGPPLTSTTVVNEAVLLDANGNTILPKKIIADSVLVDGFLGPTTQGCHLQWNRTNGDGKTWMLNNKGTGSGGITFGSITDAGVVTERMTLDDSGNLEVSGFMELGAGAPQIKMKKLTGTTPTSGSMSSVAHGLSMNKILSAYVLVNSGTGLYEPEHTGNTSGYTYSIWVGPTFIYIYLPVGTASSNIQSKPFSVLITYEL
jgi:hypothetical protein